MKVAMCEWPGRGGQKLRFDGPVVQEYEDGSVKVAARSKGPRWEVGTHILVLKEHIKGFSDQEVISPADQRLARKGV